MTKATATPTSTSATNTAIMAYVLKTNSDTGLAVGDCDGEEVGVGDGDGLLVGEACGVGVGEGVGVEVDADATQFQSMVEDVVITNVTADELPEDGTLPPPYQPEQVYPADGDETNAVMLVLLSNQPLVGEGEP